MDNTRPLWDYELSEKQVRMLLGPIKKIEHQWKVTGADTARDWIEFITDDGERFKAPNGWEKLFDFKPDHRGLIQPNYIGVQARNRLDQIAAWEKQNADDIAELKRLQEKLGMSTPSPDAQEEG